MSVVHPNPAEAQALVAQSDEAWASGKAEEALRLVDAAIAHDPNQAVAHCKRGLILKSACRWAEALAAFERGIELQPTLAPAYLDRGNALQELGRLEDALASYDRALGMAPTFAAAWCNRGTVLHRMQRFDEAIASYDRALALEPALDEARFNRSTTLVDLGQNARALEGFEQIIGRYPSLAVAHWNEALCRLRLGDFARGFRKFEWRWRYEALRLRQRTYGVPLWLGQFKLHGKTILLYPEQGHGDAIQFCRYVPLLHSQGARVVIECEPAMMPLFETLEGVDAIIPTGSEPPAFDCHTPMLSLPLAMDTRIDSIPANVPYLKAQPTRMDAWRQTAGSAAFASPSPRRRPCRIGLAWFGNKHHTNDHNRSLPLSMLVPLAALDIELVSLQRELRDQDLGAANAMSVRDMGRNIRDFGDLAALMTHLDLVISVDSAPAHLAGALGLPVWILLPFAADWRWLLDRTESPWYPTAELFRQPRPGEWGPVIRRICSRLRDGDPQGTIHQRGAAQ